MRTGSRLLDYSRFLAASIVASAFGAAASQAAAQEFLLFPSRDNVKTAIVEKIKNENVRVDVATWYLTEHEISIALVNKHKAGVPVRVLGDRVSIFEIDPKTRTEFEYLATNGVPIRLRYNPTSFPFIMHWKCGIFVGQGVVEFGSANWTPFELQPASSTNFKDETVLISDDAALVNAFKSRFDEFWADTTYFLDWPAAYKRETGKDWTTPMTIDRTRLEPDYPSPSGMVWSQGSELNNAMTAAIDQETQEVAIVLYRLSVPNITDALVRRLQAGVPVRAFVEPTQYRQSSWPEYWLTGARVDQLWVAGAQIKERIHDGLTHMKVLITSASAMQGSSNFTKNWQRDHNYFIPASLKPALYWSLHDEFDRMWRDAANYRDFYPKPPATPTLAAPGAGFTEVSVTPKLEWNRASWAVSYDVYLGTSSSSLTFQARVNAQLVEEPPLTYSWTPAQPLQPGTTYYWKVVGRTFATDLDPSLVASSATRFFTTSATGGGGSGSGPFGGTPTALPGTLQAENFDEGAQGVAYFDTSTGNAGGKYRTGTDVDIEATADSGGGFNVGWTSAGEWLNYTVNVSAANVYDLEVRVASSSAGGTFHIEVDGIDKTGPLTIPKTGGWQTWTTVRKTAVSLNAGNQVWRFVIDAAGPTGAVGNINWIRVVVPGGGSGSVPYGGTPVALPGTIEAENFDEGGQGIAYVDSTLGNAGGKYRTTDVDVETTSDAGGGFNVGWMAAGEWLKYTVDVGTAASYDIEIRVAANGSGGTFHIEVDGVDKTGPLTIPNTGGWQVWTSVTKFGASLGAGRQVWRVVIDAAGPTGIVGNFNLMRVMPAGEPPPPPPPPPPEVVIYAADVPLSEVHGNWMPVSDSTAAAGTKLSSSDLAGATVDPPLAAPVDYFDVTFEAQAGVRYRLWLRVNAADNDKFNDSIWVQFSNSVNSSGSPIYRIGTTKGLNVNMATCSTCVPAGWGWQNRAYWLSDTGDVWFATSGTQTLRVQIREDGASIDQIVLSPQQYLTTPPGPVTDDSTIVPKP